MIYNYKEEVLFQTGQNPQFFLEMINFHFFQFDLQNDFVILNKNSVVTTTLLSPTLIHLNVNLGFTAFIKTENLENVKGNGKPIAWTETHVHDRFI